jgi:hypothetical protein
LSLLSIYQTTILRHEFSIQTAEGEIPAEGTQAAADSESLS